MSVQTLQRNVSIDSKRSPYIRLPLRKDRKNSILMNPSANILDSKRSPLINVNHFEAFMPDFNVKRAKASTLEIGVNKRGLLQKIPDFNQKRVRENSLLFPVSSLKSNYGDTASISSVYIGNRSQVEL